LFTANLTLESSNQIFFLKKIFKKIHWGLV